MRKERVEWGKENSSKKAHWSSELNKMNKYCVFVLLSWKHDIPLVIKGASANFIHAINFVRVCLPSVKWKNLQWESVCCTDIELTEHQERYITNQDDREYNGTRMLCVVMIWSGHAPVKFEYDVCNIRDFQCFGFIQPTLSPMCFSSGMTYFFGLLPSLRSYGVKIVSRGFSIVLLITHIICDSTAVNLKHKNIFIELTEFCEITTMPLERPLKLVKKFLHFFGRMLCSFDELLAICYSSGNVFFLMCALS